LSTPGVVVAAAASPSLNERDDTSCISKPEEEDATDSIGAPFCSVWEADSFGDVGESTIEIGTRRRLGVGLHSGTGLDKASP
jgi:hypothetical protein